MLNPLSSCWAKRPHEPMCAQATSWAVATQRDPTTSGVDAAAPSDHIARRPPSCHPTRLLGRVVAHLAARPPALHVSKAPLFCNALRAARWPPAKPHAKLSGPKDGALNKSRSRQKSNCERGRQGRRSDMDDVGARHIADAGDKVVTIHMAATSARLCERAAKCGR